MPTRLTIALAAIAVGVGFGVYEAIQMHWISAVCAFLSGLMTAGFIGAGRQFTSQNYLGIGLTIIAALLGFFNSFFSNPALDEKLNFARNDISIALLQAKPVCSGIPNPQEYFINTSIVCSTQSNRDQMSFIADAMKQIYLPQEVGLIDVAYSSLAEQRGDPCVSRVSLINSTCPNVFLPFQKMAIRKLLAQRETGPGSN